MISSVADVARPVEHEEMTAVRREVQVVRIAADLHALDELLALASTMPRSWLLS
jgi:hypothetical protein